VLSAWKALPEPHLEATSRLAASPLRWLVSLGEAFQFCSCQVGELRQCVLACHIASVNVDFFTILHELYSMISTLF
jgi:thiamine monophosphate kinase